MSSRVPAERVTYPPPSLPELSAPHRIASEDVVPVLGEDVVSRAILYSAVDGESNREGYNAAHLESLRLQDPVQYARDCLVPVVERGRVERERGVDAEKRSGGPAEEAKAWEKVKERQERERRSSGQQKSFIRSKL